MPGSVPTPDPTVLTTEALARAINAERDYVDSQLAIRDERLSGMDKATHVLSETINRTPTEIQREVSHLRELDEEKFGSITLQFKERDVRSERESRDNKVAVDAAFAAQKEAAAKQDEANSKAIDKSEKATNETITKNAESASAADAALADKVDDIKERVNRMESIKSGSRDTIALLVSLTFLVIGVVSLAIGLSR